jgi:hypothetical protein
MAFYVTNVFNYYFKPIMHAPFRWLFIFLMCCGFSAPLHDYHVSYTNIAIEGKTAALSIRIFKDDFQEALRIFSKNPSFVLAVNPTSDKVVMDYFNHYLKLKVGHKTLKATLVSSTEQAEMWQFILTYEAAREIRRIEVYHTVLMRLFTDQRNICKVLFLPENDEQYYYYVKDAERKQFVRP